MNNFDNNFVVEGARLRAAIRVYAELGLMRMPQKGFLFTEPQAKVAMHWGGSSLPKYRGNKKVIQTPLVP